jgi:hypothetical protein
MIEQLVKFQVLVVQVAAVPVQRLELLLLEQQTQVAVAVVQAIRPTGELVVLAVQVLS